MSRIEFTAPLTVSDAKDRRVDDWPTLSQFVGRSFANTDVVGYFGQTMDEVPVAVLLEPAGDIQILSNPQGDGLLARSTIRSERALTADELEILRTQVEGQWTDGVGECLDLDGLNFFIDLDHVDRQQIEDGVVSRGSGTRDLILAIHAGDLERVRAALDAGENVNAFLGGTSPLGWAFFGNSALLVHLLIDRGADIHFRPDDGEHTFLFMCALCLSDADAASVAKRLLAMGGFEPADLDQAAELAEQFDKKQLVAVLTTSQQA